MLAEYDRQSWFLSFSEYKKARQEIKKAASDTMRLQKKAKKGIPHGNYCRDKYPCGMLELSVHEMLFYV